MSAGRASLMIIGAPLLAISLTVSFVVLMDYFRAPPDFVIVLWIVVIVNGVLAVAGSAFGMLRLGERRWWRIPATVLAGAVTFAAYLFFSFVISYVAFEAVSTV